AQREHLPGLATQVPCCYRLAELAVQRLVHRPRGAARGGHPFEEVDDEGVAAPGRQVLRDDVERGPRRPLNCARRHLVEVIANMFFVAFTHDPMLTNGGSVPMSLVSSSCGSGRCSRGLPPTQGGSASWTVRPPGSRPTPGTPGTGLRGLPCRTGRTRHRPRRRRRARTGLVRRLRLPVAPGPRRPGRPR